MKQILLSIILIGFSLSGIFAQSLQMLDEEGHDVTGDTVIFEGSPRYYFEEAIDVKNISQNALDVKIKRTLIDVENSMSHEFCWGNCYVAGLTEVSGSQLLASGAQLPMDLHFETDFELRDIIAYTAFVDGNETDSAIVYIIFDTEPQSVQLLSNKQISNPYPNPASGYFTFDYKIIPGQTGLVEIYNMLGQKVDDSVLSGEGTLLITTESYQPGAYFYKLSIEEETQKTGKLIVQ